MINNENIFSKRNGDEKTKCAEGNTKEHKFADQVELPEKEWSAAFSSFVEEERGKRRLEEEQDEVVKVIEIALKKDRKDWSNEEKDAYRKRIEYMKPQEEEQNKTKGIIDMYFDDLELGKEIFSKKIIDIGCGRNAELIEHAIEKLNSKNTYGLDKNLEEYILQKYPHNLYKGSFDERLPIDNLDLIIARASLSELDLMQERFLENILSNLNEEGELRVFPLFKNHIESEYKEALAKEREFIEKLDELSKKLNFDYQLKVKEISVYGKDRYPVSKNLLVIKKKKVD